MSAAIAAESSVRTMFRWAYPLQGDVAIATLLATAAPMSAVSVDTARVHRVSVAREAVRGAAAFSWRERRVSATHSVCNLVTAVMTRAHFVTLALLPPKRVRREWAMSAVVMRGCCSIAMRVH